MKISKQSASKTKRKAEKRKQKYHKTTRNLVSGDSPEMRFFVLKKTKEKKESDSAIDSLGEPGSRENRRFRDLKRRIKIAKNVAKISERRKK